jgi:hypothetical protein
MAMLTHIVWHRLIMIWLRVNLPGVVIQVHPSVRLLVDKSEKVLQGG